VSWSPERIAAVVVTYNSAAVLPGLIHSLASGFGPLQYQLVVVDNGSSDGSLTLATELAPGATFVGLGCNVGYAAGINAGVAAAGAHSAILVLNADIRLRAGAIPALMETLRRTGSGIVVPRIVDGDGRLVLSQRRDPTVIRAFADAFLGASRAGRFPLTGEVVSDSRSYAQERRVDWAQGSIQLISTECWKACGPWDESFFLYSEETDFDLRARDAGYAVTYTPTAVVEHLGGDSRVSPELWSLLMINRLRLFRMRHGPMRCAMYRTALIIREAVRAVLGRRTGRSALAALLGIGSPSIARGGPADAAG
jgi:GT2 family glycosyltransferase